MDSQFRKNVLDVIPNRFRAQDEPIRNIRLAETIGQEVKDSPLLGG